MAGFFVMGTQALLVEAPMGVEIAFGIIATLNSQEE